MKFVGKGWLALALATVVAACEGGGTNPAVATSITATSATTQQAIAGTAVAQAPAVRVLDQRGDPMPGVTVSFTVAGGGTVAASSAITDAAGNATSGTWTLGATAGNQTVTAGVPSLQPVQFTATAQDPCQTATTFTLGAVVSGSLGGADCHLSSGEYVDHYAVNLPSAQAVSFTMSSSSVDSWLEMYDANGNILAVNDDGAEGTVNSTIRVFAPSGNYFLSATSYDPDETGAYQLSSAGVAGNANCDEYWVVPGVSITGSIANTDCNFGGYYADDYLVVLYPNQTLNVRMESTAVDSYLALYDQFGDPVVEDDDSAGGNNAQLSYRNPGSSPILLVIDAGTFGPGATGAYTLSVTRS
ncbi:Ig-like domain-containing protein [Longimicrobium sp.]|uniref:Ig-like domain-containing protein n=1 Tax=Longimicrobium sp. TaxID=2029185 RepID=UPI002E35509D|nr:Ig-like domain-containing protein [Longimicrobium sp.]HEX6037535.1 Ig-like domain-containing protein [Longimicrobium sp.]